MHLCNSLAEFTVKESNKITYLGSRITKLQNNQMTVMKKSSTYGRDVRWHRLRCVSAVRDKSLFQHEFQHGTNLRDGQAQIYFQPAKPSALNNQTMTFREMDRIPRRARMQLSSPFYRLAHKWRQQYHHRNWQCTHASLKYIQIDVWTVILH